MGGGAGPAVLLADDTDPAGEAQDPIDLVSDTSESTDNHSDSDDSSAVVVVEPTDQAAADVPRLAVPRTSLNTCSMTRVRRWSQ